MIVTVIMFDRDRVLGDWSLGQNNTDHHVHWGPSLGRCQREELSCGRGIRVAGGKIGLCTCLARTWAADSLVAPVVVLLHVTVIFMIVVSIQLRKETVLDLGVA